MNVQELIESLEDIEDKEMIVGVVLDPNDPPRAAVSVSEHVVISDDFYTEDENEREEKHIIIIEV